MEERDPPEHEWDEADGHHGEVQHVEPAPAEAAGVEQEPVRDYFEQTLDCKYCCKEVVEVVEYLKNEAVKDGRMRSLLSSASKSSIRIASEGS